ncbi:MAG: hypothetical protein EXS05_21155 [Planctomycetaceae bacterium]|nr:hypothetical protein [Planctomycetaceae bacterium]
MALHYCVRTLTTPKIPAVFDKSARQRHAQLSKMGLAVHLRGVVSDRDAIGATVRITAGAITRVGQLTAGDGYQASNQRHLIFGLGPFDRADELSVRWPSGLEQTFHDIATGQEILLIEGSRRLVFLARDPAF